MLSTAVGQGKAVLHYIDFSNSDTRTSSSGEPAPNTHLPIAFQHPNAKDLSENLRPTDTNPCLLHQDYQRTPNTYTTYPSNLIS